MQGFTDKLLTRLAQPVEYEFILNEDKVPLNPLLGRAISLKFTGRIRCVHCGNPTKKSFNQGYCYPCFIRLAQCDMCILKPETCHYYAGTCREPEWGEAFCFQPHIVYLANSSGIKVGITRQSQLPTRWIDQGAVQALPVFRVASRYQSGLIEVVLARYVSDKTSWQQMLKADAMPLDLIAKRDELIDLCRPELTAISEHSGKGGMELLTDAEPVTITYPIDKYPAKVKSFNFDTQPEVAGILEGIKGQYLLLDTGVINIRKFTGYELELNI